jgi:YVTN family beta-propeller protein
MLIGARRCPLARGQSALHHRDMQKLALFALALFVATTAPAAAQVTATFEAQSDRSFGNPHDIVLSPDGSKLYVADVNNNAVKVLDPQSLATIGAFGTAELSRPHDVAFDREGRLLVADTGNDRIAIYALSGVTGELVDEIGGLASPEGVVVARDGTIYLTNVGRHNVEAWRDGERVARRGGRGSGANEYVRPHDIDIGPDGHIYVSDPGNDRIQMLDDALRVVGGIGGERYDFNEPKYFAINGNGWIFVADEFNHQVKILNKTLEMVGVIGSGKSGPGANEFDQPEGAEIRGTTLWVSDTRNGRITRFSLTGLPPAR